MRTLPESGYEVVHGVFSVEEIGRYCVEEDRVASVAGSVCVRHLRARSDLFKALSFSERLFNLLPETFIPVRSILFDKTPDQNWPVAWHQDLTIAVAGTPVAGKGAAEEYGPWSVKEGVVHVQPPVALLEKMITLRVHLDETSRENGALKVIPGSHRLGRIAGDSIADLVDGSEVVCECRPGDVLLMSPLLLHSSSRSLTPSRRRIAHFEYAPYHALAKGISWHETIGDASSPAL